MKLLLRPAHYFMATPTPHWYRRQRVRFLRRVAGLAAAFVVLAAWLVGIAVFVGLWR